MEAIPDRGRLRRMRAVPASILHSGIDVLARGRRRQATGEGAIPSLSEREAPPWLEGRGQSNRGFLYAAAFAIGLSAVAIPLLIDAQYDELRCSDHAQRVLGLARGLSNRSDLVNLRKKFAQAALLCSEGMSTEANLRLTEIETALENLARKPRR